MNNIAVSVFLVFLAGCVFGYTACSIASGWIRRELEQDNLTMRFNILNCNSLDDLRLIEEALSYSPVRPLEDMFAEEDASDEEASERDPGTAGR